MSRVVLKPKDNYKSLNIAVGIDPPFQCWFIQVFTEVNVSLDGEEWTEPSMLVDLDTSNRWKVIEVIDKYANLEDEFTAKVREQIMLDLDPGLLIEQPIRMIPLDITKMDLGEIK